MKRSLLLAGLLCFAYGSEAQIVYDASVSSTDIISQYTEIPLTQAAPLPLRGVIANSGLGTIHDVMLQVKVLDANGVQVGLYTSPVLDSLPILATDTFTAGNWKPQDTGMFTIKYYHLQAESDLLPLNDTVYQFQHIIDTIYARDNDTLVGSLGIGAGNGGYLGNEFEFFDSATIKSIILQVARGYTGERYALCIWNIDSTSGMPDTIVATTDTLLYPDDSAREYNVMMHGGPVMLPAGRYAFTAIEFDSTLAVGLTNSKFTLGKTWVDWPTSPIPGWAHNEDFGPSFQKAYMIRAVLQYDVFGPLDIALNSFTVKQGSCSNIVTASFNVSHDMVYAALQHSADGKNFEQLKTWKLSESGEINYTQATNDNSRHYYRLAYKGIDGRQKYSEVKTIVSGCGSALTATSVFPNPVSGTSITVRCITANNEQLQLSLIDANGKVVYSWNKTVGEGSNNIDLDISNTLSGLYTLKVVHENGVTETLQVQKIAK